MGGHPGKRGVDGGTDGGPPPPGPVAILNVMIEGNGRIVSSLFECASTCTVPVPVGAPLELSAEGRPGFVLVEWTGVCAGAPECRIEVAGDALVGAIFAHPPP